MSGNRGRGGNRGRKAKPGNDRNPKSFVPAPVPTTPAWVLQQTTSHSSDKPNNSLEPNQSPNRLTCQTLSAALPDALPNSSNVSSEQRKLKLSTEGPSDQRGAGSSNSRGAVRDGRVISDIVRTRPENLSTKRGTDGKPVSLTANYYRILKAPTWQLYQYRVDFSPEIVNRGFKNRLIKDQKANLGGYLFDGTMLFLTVKLQEGTTEIITKDMEGNPIQIKIKFVGLLSMTTAASIQVLNLILRRSMGALNLKLIGRNFFDAEAMVNIQGHKLQILPGYQTSIRQHEVDILLCVGLTSKVMRKETILDILIECYRDCHKRNNPDWKKAFLSIVLGMIVFTEHNNRTYRIDDVDFTKSPRSTFITKTGEMTFNEYYKDKYKFLIRDQKQPLLIQRPSDRDIRNGRTETDLIALIPELCRTTGLNDQQRKDFRLMNAVAEHTRLSPNRRIDKLKAFNKRLQDTESEDANSKDADKKVKNLQEWNLKLDSNLVEVAGRVLKPETILFGNRNLTNNEEADWSRTLRNIQMYSTVHLANWDVIVPQQCERDWNNFTDILREAARSIGYNINRPRIHKFDDSHKFTTELELAAKNNPQLIMCILAFQDSTRYGIIKKKCCLDRGIPTQVLVANTIIPKRGKPLSSLLSIATKLVIQINSKLGGVPWMIDIPLTNIMIIGFDVCHDTKDRSKSYGAMVATMDVHRKFFSAVSAHKNGQELSDEFSSNITKALTEYKQEHHVLPFRILIYRDGVGEGDTGYVFEHELSNIRTRLDTIYGGNSYQMAFIVVSKRINTRFFNETQNPSPGTVVDDVVTLPERYDFFLVSQSVRNGTVSPTNYNVIYDTLGLSPNRLQTLTYKMTHLYYNWSGTISVPAVCQYAHKLAYLVGNYIHQPPTNILEKQLYFL